MNDVERRAYDCYKKSEWQRALEYFEKLISSFTSAKNPKYLPNEKLLSYLIAKSECNFALGRNDSVFQDCSRILKSFLETKNAINVHQKDKVQRLLLKSLLCAERYEEAKSMINEWLLKQVIYTSNTRKVLEQVKAKLEAQCNNQLQEKFEEDLKALDLNANGVKSVDPNQRAIGNNKMPPEGSVRKVLKSSGDFSCSYCAIRFSDITSLRAHCQTNSHQTIIMSDDGRDWKYRPPPRGLTADAYTLCEGYKEKNGSCRYGDRCVEAHGAEELREWKERFEYRRMKVQKASEKQLYGKSYTEQLLEKWINARSPDAVMKEKIDNVEESISDDLTTSVSSKNGQREWTFLLKTPMTLKAVALLQDAHRSHFSLRQVSTGDAATVTSDTNWNPSNDQEWTVDGRETNQRRGMKEGAILEHRIRVAFKTEIYGTFRQSVVFDFGTEPALVKHICVDVVPLTDFDKMKEIQKELIVSSGERWCADNSTIVPFVSTLNPPNAASISDQEKERKLIEAYPTPRGDSFTITQSTIMEKGVTKNNYRDRMHELLNVEEMARYEQVARYNVTQHLKVVSGYYLAPNGMSNSTAKYAHGGELFAVLTMGKDISEDTSAGRLILNNCSTVFISCDNLSKDSRTSSRVVYEALIEDKGKSIIYLRLGAAMVTALGLRADTSFYCQVQFQLNRIIYCEWHYAVDKIADYRFLFPDSDLEPSIPWSPQRQWSKSLDQRLNLKQREAVVAITSPSTYPLPPILIIGPFGTGKTYTLAQAIKQLLSQSDTRILVCTHSNSAADLYIKDYLHPHVEAGHEEAKPLRIYYHKRWVTSVNSVVQKYCLIESQGGIPSFKVPSLEDIMKHRIVVVTLSTSMYLSSLGLEKGHFTHILLDEAAQAMECEAIMPLALANENTRIVLAGDHMQLSPELFSQFAKDRNLHVSLLERLYDHYPVSFPCKILLCENYRAHEAIINFTSELFYDQKLVSSGKQPRHEKFYPLTFFTTRGEDVQDVNSTAFYNNSEVYEVVERVCELRKQWPASWGKLEDTSIGVMTPYADQVFRIRSELRKRRLGCISVERVLNVQGKQFRAIFLSTVRTRRTCLGSNGKPVNEMDFGFLSNWKLLNTAITRAQSLVAVIGDPVALCSIGKCRKVWERFIEVCNENNSLYGTTWNWLRSQLDGVELKKSYTLNPLAPEFVPRSLQNEAYIKLPTVIPGFATGRMPSFLPPAINYPVFYPPANQAPPPFPLRPPGVALPYIGAPAPWPPFSAMSPSAKKEEVKAVFGIQPQKSPVMMDMKTLLPNLDGLDGLSAQGLRPNPLPMHGMNGISHIPLAAPVIRPGLEFLNNVHFPERQPIRTSVPAPAIAPTDWRLFLPPNMSFADVLKSHAIQDAWYRRLATLYGLDVANKFKDLVIRANEKTLSPPTEQQVPVNVIDRGSDMGMNSKPLHLRDLEANMLSQAQIQAHRPQQVVHQPPPRLTQPSSLPLYRRQTSMPNFQPPSMYMQQQQAPPQPQQQQQPQQQAPPPPPPPPAAAQYTNDFHLNGREQELDESASSKHNVETTYASVLRKQPPRGSGIDNAKDPFCILKGLARTSSTQNNGLYQYFS